MLTKGRRHHEIIQKSLLKPLKSGAIDLEFDHLAVAGETLEDAVSSVENTLGLSLSRGGQHPHFGTHNFVMSLGGMEYLEVIAIDPSATPIASPRWFDLDRFKGEPRLSNWICRVDDIAAVPPHVGDPVALTRGDLKWTMAVPTDGILPYDNCFPALIEWQGPHPALRLPDVGARLERLTISHPEALMLSKELPIFDKRLSFEPGPAGLHAEIATPHGLRVLE